MAVSKDNVRVMITLSKKEKSIFDEVAGRTKSSLSETIRTFAVVGFVAMSKDLEKKEKEQCQKKN